MYSLPVEHPLVTVKLPPIVQKRLFLVSKITSLAHLEAGHQLAGLRAVIN